MKSHHRWVNALRITYALAVSIVFTACNENTAPQVGLGSHLNEQQAAFVFPEERPFFELAQAVPTSAGFFIDTATGNVIVSLTNLKDAARAKGLLRSSLATQLARIRVQRPSADVVARQAQYNFLQLMAWRDQMRAVLGTPGVDWLDLDEVRNQVVVGVDPGASLKIVRQTARSIGMPEPALGIEVDGPVRNLALLTDSIRPIAGGTQIEQHFGTVVTTCTLGFPAMRNGKQLFVTASHCTPTRGAVDSIRFYQPVVPLNHADSLTHKPIGVEIADTTVTCPPHVNGTCSDADASLFLYIDSSNTFVLGRVARPTFGCFPGPCSPVNLTIGSYFQITATVDTGIMVGALVSHIGVTTGWDQHFVTKSCADVVSSVSGIRYLCQDEADFADSEGDSGGPVLLNINSLPDSTVTLGGVLWGSSPKFRTFSPWSQVKLNFPGLTVH